MNTSKVAQFLYPQNNNSIPFAGYCSEGADRDRSMSGDSVGLRFRGSRRGYPSHQGSEQETLSWIPEQVGPVIVHGAHHHDNPEEKQISPKLESGHMQSKSQHQIHPQPQDDSYLAIPKTMAGSSSSDTLTGKQHCIPCKVFADEISYSVQLFTYRSCNEWTFVTVQSKQCHIGGINGVRRTRQIGSANTHGGHV